MLRELRIRDFAIIDDLSLSFRPGLNVITGETGAGKSIILQALALLSGARAVPDFVRSEATDASIEGLFDDQLSPGALESLGIAPDDELLVRRQISRNGKSRIHVNGSPATLALLARVGEHLVHIYGQHDQALLLRAASHLDFLDGFAALGNLREEMRASYERLLAARHHLRELEARRSRAGERTDLLRYQIQELSAARIRPEEEDVLRRERNLIRHAEHIHRVCREGEAVLYAGDGAVGGALARLVGHLAELKDVAPDLVGATELIETARVQIEEAARELGGYAERANFDPVRLEEIDERLATLNRLARKYGKPSSELSELLGSLEAELSKLEDEEFDHRAALAELSARESDAVRVAAELSTARAAAARRLETEMDRELAVIGMSGARFRVVHEPSESDAGALGATGADLLEFHLAANPGEPPRPLARIASGGELSRIMLALKALTASARGTSVLIFDEVDAGIGGAVADAVGRRLKKLARCRQLLCITHLPQIAACADHHYSVEKRSERGRTVAEAHLLDQGERVRELSRMLGGAAAPAEAERYARRLIAEGQRGID